MAVAHMKNDIKYVKCRIQSYNKAQYGSTFINILLIIDIDSCEEYLKFVLHSDKENRYFDIYINRKNAPPYIKALFSHIKDNSRIALSEEDNLGYIIYGPNLLEKNIYKMTYIYLNDYHRMMNQLCEFIYNEELNLNISLKWLNPIYKNVIKNKKMIL